MSTGVKILLAVLFGLFSLVAQFATAYLTGYGIHKLDISAWWWFLWAPIFFLQGMAFQANREWAFKLLLR